MGMHGELESLNACDVHQGGTLYRHAHQAMESWCSNVWHFSYQVIC